MAAPRANPLAVATSFTSPTKGGALSDVRANPCISHVDRRFRTFLCSGSFHTSIVFAARPGLRFCRVEDVHRRCMRRRNAVHGSGTTTALGGCQGGLRSSPGRRQVSRRSGTRTERYASTGRTGPSSRLPYIAVRFALLTPHARTRDLREPTLNPTGRG
jgi:hypothetical protein